MESMEDDFGDLYADVKVQASAAIGGLHIEPEGNSPTDGSKSTEADEKFVADSAIDDSDSEDDLNIVLNDDDCEKFPVIGARSHGGGYDGNENGDFGVERTGLGKISRQVERVSDGSELNPSGNGVERGSGTKIELHSRFKYARPHVSSFPSNTRVNGLTGMSSFSSMSRRGDLGDDVYDQNMVASMKSLPHQFGYVFSLPWYRTILDVNIDAFEEKPWRRPGADITDFFNFGFNEDSWKEYCNSLEKFRQQLSRQARIPSRYSSKFDQGDGIEVGHERVTREAMSEDVANVDSSLKFADRGEMLLQLPKGRAIQVEDSINERQPSMDIRRPRFQDSDVIIQIPVQDSTVDSSNSEKEELDHGSKSEVLESGKLDQDDRDVCYFVSVGSDAPKGDYARVINVSTSSLGRSLPASNQTSPDTGDHSKVIISDMNGKCLPNMEVGISEGTAEAMETKNKGNEVAFRNTHQPDAYIPETEPSLDNRSYFIPAFSFSEDNSEERSEDSVRAASVETQSPLRRETLDSGTGLRKSVDNKSSGSNSHKTKSDDREKFSVHTIPLRDEQKESWKQQHYVKERILVESDDEYDTYRLSDAEGDGKRCPRHGKPTQEKWKHCRGRPYGTINQKIYPENCYEASHLSNARELCYKDYASVNHGKRKERSEHLVYHDKKSSSYYRDKEPYVDRSKRFTDSHLSAFDRKAYLYFREDSDWFAIKKWNEEEFYHERQAYILKEDDMDGFLYRGRRHPAWESLFPRACEESGSLISSNSPASSERDIQWTRGNSRLQFRKKTDHGDFPLDCRHEDEWLRDKYGTPISFAHSKSGMVEPYERGRPPIRREVKVSARKSRYVDCAYFHLDRSGPTESEDEYQRHTQSRSLALATDRELSAHNGRRWFNTVPSRNEEYDSNQIDRCHRHQRLAYHEEDLDGAWFNSYNYTEDYDLQNDNQVQSWGRGHSKRSRVIHWREDKLLVNDRLFAQGVPFSSEKSSKHDLILARHGSLRDEMLLNDSMLDHHGYEMITEGNTYTCHKRKSFFRYRGEHEQEVLKDRDPVNLIVGEGKSSGRHADSRNTVCNGRLKKTCSEYPMELKSVREFNDSFGSKAVNMDIPSTDGRRNNEKQFGKLSVTKCNKDLDIEEGQIINEAQSIEDTDLEKENASEIMMQCNKVKVKTLPVDNASVQNRAVGECENKRILETRAKMEKRRERFKDPITIKREPDKTSAPQVELVVQTVETKKQRPARKRQWSIS